MNPFVLNLIIGAACLVIGWVAREFNFLRLGSGYDKVAEEVENLTAEEAQAFQEWERIFGKKDNGRRDCKQPEKQA